MIASVVLQTLIIFWWWLRHCTGDLVPICLLSILFKWYFLFWRVSPLTNYMNPFRNCTYFSFYSQDQCRLLNFLTFLKSSSSPYLLLRGLKNHGFTESKLQALWTFWSEEGSKGYSEESRTIGQEQLMGALYYIVQLNYRVTMTIPILIHAQHQKYSSALFAYRNTNPSPPHSKTTLFNQIPIFRLCHSDGIP